MNVRGGRRAPEPLATPRAMREPMSNHALRARTAPLPSLPASQRRARHVYAALAMILLACACPRPVPISARATPAASAPAPTSAEPSLRPTLLPIAELPRLDLAARLGAYLSQGAAWVPGQPLAVNRDYDFMLAMSIDSGVGAGLAAKKRQDENRAFAQRLTALSQIDSNALLDALCRAAPQHGCAARAGQGVRIYGLLFGDTDARLLVVLETRSTADEPTLHAVLANRGDSAAWHEPGTLQRSFARALYDLAADLEPGPPPTDATTACQLTGGAKLAGQIVATHADRTVLLISPHTLRLSCPTSALEPKPAAPPTP